MEPSRLKPKEANMQVSDEKWNEAYPWATVGSDNFEEYMEVQATEPGRSTSTKVSDAARLWRDRVRADIRQHDFYGGPGLPRPSHPDELEAAVASFRAYQVAKGPGPYEPDDTYAAWLLENP